MPRSRRRRVMDDDEDDDDNNSNNNTNNDNDNDNDGSGTVEEEHGDDDDDDNNNDDDDAAEEHVMDMDDGENQEPVVETNRRGRKASTRRQDGRLSTAKKTQKGRYQRRASLQPDNAMDLVVDDVDEEENVDDNANGSTWFSSQLHATESQEINVARNSDRVNMHRMSEAAQQRAISDLTRIILFRHMVGDPIDRLACVKEAAACLTTPAAASGGSGSTSNAAADYKRISSALLEEANNHLRNLFDFELRRIPPWMTKNKNIGNKMQDRMFLVNKLHDDADLYSQHCKKIHSVHDAVVVDRALLMMVLAFCYCKGTPRSDSSRWIADTDLYRLLHALDENIPAEPPSGATTARGRRRLSAVGNGESMSQFHSLDSMAGSCQRRTNTNCRDKDDVAWTPNVDAALARFVKLNYLLEEPAPTDQNNNNNNEMLNEDSVLYSMGPRAAIEIGRRQIVYFCAEILDEQPDETMLLELRHDEDVGDDDNQQQQENVY